MPCGTIALPQMMICDYVFTNILGCEVEDELRNVVLSNDSLLSNSLSLHLSLSLCLPTSPAAVFTAAVLMTLSRSPDPRY